MLDLNKQTKNNQIFFTGVCDEEGRVVVCRVISE